MMRKIGGLIVLVLFPAWTLTAIAPSDIKERTDAARAVAADFGLTLIAEHLLAAHISWAAEA